MKPKRRTPLQKLWLSATVKSCANGTMWVEPQWPGKPWNEEDGGGPGVATRMYAARQLQQLIRRHLRGRVLTDALGDIIIVAGQCSRRHLKG